MEKYRRDMAELTIMPSLKTHLHFALSYDTWRNGYFHLVIWPLLLWCQANKGSILDSKKSFKIPQISGNTLKMQPEITSTCFQFIWYLWQGQLNREAFITCIFILNMEKRKSRCWEGLDIPCRESMSFPYIKK